MDLPAADSRLVYLGLLALVIVQRLVELRLARRNHLLLLARGGVEEGTGHYPWMVLQHAAFLVACPLEVYLLARPLRPALAVFMVVVLFAAMALRAWVLRTLGERWTTRVIVLPGEAAIAGGPYRYVRHPNYLAVVLEIFALPLVHGAWLTALVFSLLNGALLAVRIRAEEAALTRASHYQEVFGDRPRLLPGSR